MLDTIIYHYAFGPMKIISENDEYIEVEVLNQDGLAHSLKKLVIDNKSRWFHKKALGVILFKDETAVKNFIRQINGGVFTLNYNQYFNQVPHCLYISKELIHKDYLSSNE